MEFVRHDGEKLNKIYINNNASYININNKKHAVNKIILFTDHEGKLITNDYIIRYTKGVLYLYDLNHNVLGIYNFSKFRVDDTNDNDFFIFTGDDSGMLINKFILKKDYYLELRRDNTNNYYILNNGKKENIKEIYNIGNDTVYTTDSDNKLQISKIRNSKWNGIPIGNA